MNTTQAQQHIPPFPPARSTHHVVQLLHHALNDLRLALQQLGGNFLVQPGLGEGTH